MEGELRGVCGQALNDLLFEASDECLIGGDGMKDASYCVLEERSIGDILCNEYSGFQKCRKRARKSRKSVVDFLLNILYMAAKWYGILFLGAYRCHTACNRKQQGRGDDIHK